MKNAYLLTQAQVQAPTQSAPSTAAPAAQPVDTIWSCSVKLPGETELTVGTKFTLNCEGPSIELDQKTLALDVSREQKYALRILETKTLNPDKAEFIATTWVAGEVKVSNPVLTDGKKRVSLGEISLNVKSVVDQQSNPESKPFPPWSPLAMAWPLWIWLGFAVLAVIFSTFVGFKLRRVLRRKKLLRLLDKNPIAISAYHQFNKDIRRLVRLLPGSGEWGDTEARAFFVELDMCLRWFLSRELVIPTFDRKAQEVLRDLKSSDRALHDSLSKDLAIILTEIEKTNTTRGKIMVLDAQQLTELARQFADQVRKAKLREV